ncbi:YesK-like family protein [Niallia taxi]|uniref:YesK-like family protein n=1 Tax=Niallia taxi TaxID=2499688 RepID=UPI0021A34355|nr:YesK-like family protein [Niallia taxi]MCT2346308.1 YesK-like family protein [Niallia taxi]MDE5051665.1 YesK-like family protein [Niallia taxi]
MMFSILFLIGLLIGSVSYVITYIYGKEISNVKRSIAVTVVGVISLIVSMVVIGGFEGMPFGVISAGIILMAIVFFLIGKIVFLRKTVILGVVVYALIYAAYIDYNQVNYWIDDKTVQDQDGNILAHLHNIETDTSIKGFKVFTIMEGQKEIALSLGEKMAGNRIEVTDVENKEGQTEVHIRTTYNQSEEKNPYILVGLDNEESEIVVIDTDGTVYEELK